MPDFLAGRRRSCRCEFDRAMFAMKVMTIVDIMECHWGLGE